ncbi:HDOD domain-containing protein [Aestuariirhabdus sp. Z084]|uniref:HDOD domain-containing protein n=1 Tax=Aestuariirhabdus haliotis TaxID=2918751 RepID=UPI00201B39EE|nr:HDOD domain-containing protein [Aestuariirhabdus haliotis]MCL6415834.1 HDOD domain-containing protein [Aestuariirhabdus haliotis]MCL6419864.1 HDOD domain-containing protein [Aestuariirhabdus haliotis]
MAGSRYHLTLYKRILDGEVELPCLPDVSLRIRQTLTRSDYHLNDLVELLQGDPAIAGHLLKMADSPLYHQPTPAMDLMTAVQRMGASATGNIVITYSIKNLFFPRNPLAMQYMRELWHHSLKNAAICSILAKQSTVIEPAQAMLAGLLQEIGNLLLLLHIDEEPELLNDPTQVYRMFDEVGADIGVVLLKFWGLDELFVEAVRERNHWGRDSRLPFDLVDLSILARHLSLGDSARRYNAPPLEELALYQKSSFAFMRRPRSVTLFDYLRDDIEQMLILLGGSMTPPSPPKPARSVIPTLRNRSE